MNPAHHKLTELLIGTDQLKLTAYSSHNLKRFSEDEIEKITSKYEKMIGQGAFGKVYKGILADRSKVAVKKLYHNDGQMKQGLAKEIIVHSQINHQHVTRLIGYCLEENAMMLVTEYIPCGNLSDFLHQDARPISLDTRLRIAMECAQALGYMHSHMDTHVIHGDIKPDNILLNQNLNAKISDFGISRLVNTDKSLYTMHVIGSIGYMDPLLVRTGRVTPKSDVYSFGVVLLEMLARKKATTEKDGLSLVDSFILALSKGFGRVRKMLDTEIAGWGDSKIFEGAAKLVGECLSMEIHKRPEMTNVAERLQELRRAYHEEQGQFSRGWMSKPSYTPGKKVIPAVELELEDLLFSQAVILGQGMFGEMYKVVLNRGTVVVMKRLNSELREHEFRRRVGMLRDVQSDLVMPLRLHHCSKSERLLVYDYMPMGSLAALLHGGNDSAGGQANWEQRSSIALTVARALAAIHSTGPAFCHGNIKSSNIFLASDYEARLSEHGLHTLVDTSFPGSSGYHAPEITVIARDTSKESDVYSFGILLLEMLTGQPPENMLLQWVQSVACKEWTTKVLDTDVRKQHKNAEFEMLLFLRLAIVCCAQVADERPAMSEVVQKIEGIRQFIRIMYCKSLSPDEMFPFLRITGQEAQEQAPDTAANEVLYGDPAWGKGELERPLPPPQSPWSPPKPPQISLAIDEVEEEEKERAKNEEEEEKTQPPLISYVGSAIGAQNKLASDESSLPTTLIKKSALPTIMAKPVVKGTGTTLGATWKVRKESAGIMVPKVIEEQADLPKSEFDRRIAAIKDIKSELLVPLHYWRYFVFGNGNKAIMHGYMHMGSLAALLHGNGAYGGRYKFHWGWEQRSAIALTVARGIAAIHSAGLGACCHGNIMSSNVILTSNYEARLSESGLYTLVNTSSFVAAIRESGYLAPELVTGTRITQEADVFSFGILLIELLTAREPSDALRAKGLDLSQWVHSVAREDWMLKVFDVELVAQQGAAAQGMEQLLHLAMDCCTSFDLRPKISEVVSRIEDVRASRPPRGTFYQRTHIPLWWFEGFFHSGDVVLGAQEPFLPLIEAEGWDR